MQMRRRSVAIEAMETRLLLAAAPVILKVSDAVEAGNSFTINGGGINATGLDIAIAPYANDVQSTGAVFEANFDGTGNGTGPGNIVQSGGTGTLATATGITNIVSAVSPFTPGSGSYLNARIAQNAPNYLPYSVFNFASASNSFTALQGANVSGYTALKGGFDIFCRPNLIASGDSGYFRPIDTTTGAGGGGLRLIFNGNSNGGLVLQLHSNNGVAVSNFTSLSGGSSFSDGDDVWLTGGNITSPGQVYHTGFTLNTDATGLITAKVFLTTGAGAIDTSAAPLVAATFRLNASVVGAAFNAANPWTLRELSANHAAGAANVDFDSARLYGSTPGSFLGLPLSAPPANAIHPQIVQTDKDSHYVVAKAPANLTPGVYNVWVKNADGWSSPYKMNAARALFMSDYEAYYSATKPIKIEVVGRNLDQSEFGGATATQVRLNNNAGGLYNQTITSLNPYNVTFSVGNVPVGTYSVEVSNDSGINWSRPGSGQTLTIVATPSGDPDPLNLGVTWAKDFKWTSVFNVTSYGANGADLLNDTTAVQNAMNAAENAGGGVVYFPNGSYYINNLVVGRGVVLQGQSTAGAKLYYTGAGNNVFINTKGNNSVGGIPQLQGVANLSIRLSVDSIRPDQFITLGNPWGSATHDQSLRTANRIFISGVDLNYSYTSGSTTTSRGIGALWVGKERVLMKDNHFVGWYATNAVTYMNQYCTLKNNYYEYSTGYVHGTASYSFYENNTVKVHGEYLQDSHGLFGRSDAYMANNYVEGTGSDNPDPDGNGTFDINDGEGICVEMPGGLFNRGSVNSATPTTLAVTPATTLIYPTVQYGTLSVAITYGAGMGQLRKVVSIDSATNTITVDKPFDILPDATSTFTLYTPLEHFTVYNNTLRNCVAGILPYGAQNDAVVADNTLIDTVGIYVHSARGDTTESANQYVRIARNTITGVSRRSKTSAIGVYTGRFDGTKFVDAMTYSVEILDNSITGDLTKVMDGRWYFPAYNGIYLSSHIFSNMSDGTGTGDITNTLIERNALSNLQAGIMLTKGDYGHVISDNTTDATVVQFLRDNGSQNTLVTSDNFSTKGFNITSQGTLVTSALSPLGSQGSTDINIIRDGITPLISPQYNGGWDDVQSQTSQQYDNIGSTTQYYGYTFSGNRTFSKIVFVEGRHFGNGGWFANGSLKVQVRQGGNWVDVPSAAVRAYPNGNSLATFGTGYEGYAFNLNNVLGDGIRIYGTAGGSSKYVSISELEVWALPAAPASVALQINGGLAQRSMVTSLALTFDQPVTLATDAISLSLRGGTGNLALSVVNPSGDQKNYVVNFTGTGIIGGSLADGVYELTVRASSVVDEYGQILTGGNRVFTFHRLFGDSNGDKTVNNFDYSQFKKTYGLSSGSTGFNPALDYEGNGLISNSDYSQFKKRYGTSVIY